MKKSVDGNATVAHIFEVNFICHVQYIVLI
jgi:hypothetical protein